MKIKPYTPEHKSEWDEFVRNSKNGTFLFYRDFIEYHGDRFGDYSLLFYCDDILTAIMPGYIADKIYYSHGGLTYGGLIMANHTTAANVLELMEHLTV
ncbi:GNAT family N-acetyltransferase, partial [Dysgonomonas sp. OttesenSCG-928-D17]|nr:GNAT family N-acetyltransferase [Dysgonomonas sp. OttesenSCG-928-D17]